jgi:hypothetical protein
MIYRAKSDNTEFVSIFSFLTAGGTKPCTRMI